MPFLFFPGKCAYMLISSLSEIVHIISNKLSRMIDYRRNFHKQRHDFDERSNDQNTAQFYYVMILYIIINKTTEE